MNRRRTVLTVDSKLFIAIAGEVHNSRSSSLKYMVNIWKQEKETGLNMLLLPQKSFELVIQKCQPCAVMSSYKLVNGEHTCNSRDILTNVLRDEWGYEGLVMTDWYVTSHILQIVQGRKNKYEQASAAGCVKVGNALIMPGMASDREDILKEWHAEENPLTKAELQLAAKQVLLSILRMCC